MADTHTFRINTLGKYALRVLREEKMAKTIGVTSRGVFLQTASGQVTFLGLEKYRGPLTVNLPSSFSKRLFPHIGDPVLIGYPRLSAKEFSLLIDSAAEIQDTTEIVFPARGMPDVEVRISVFSTDLLQESSGSPFVPLLKIAANTTPHPLEKAEALHIWFDENFFVDTDHPLGFLTPLIGYGAGLTPSGDDFICGYLLASYYLASSEKTAVSQILKAARSNTTTLSASLIACAAEGLADERLINTLRYLAENTTDAKEIKEELLTYGSSSGIDSFAGMFTAILFTDRDQLST